MRSNNTIYTEINPQPQSSNTPEKFARLNFEESQLDNPGSSHSQRPLFGTENTMKPFNKSDTLLPQLKLSSEGEHLKKLTQPKETGISEEKKILVLRDVILKPVEMSTILESMQMNEKFDRNAVKIGNTDNGRDGVIIIEQMSGSSMVGSQ